ncbi:MAG TPA: hypothetical protein VIL42_07445 [Sphingomicrobium sp.]|jgi:hypothetical protein
MIMLGAAVAVLAGCGQQAESPDSNTAAKKTAPKKERPPYCFFKATEMKDWKAKRDKSGNVVVSATLYRSDPAYKALLSPATIAGASAEIRPTITVNDTGYAAPGNWWAVSQTIPGSAAVTKVTVLCGEKTTKELSVPRRK